MLSDQIYITRGHAREAGWTASEKIERPRAHEGRPWWGPLVRVWGMRLLVSRLCGSINARARSVHFKTAHDGRSHTFSKLRTLGRGRLPGVPFSDVACSMKKSRGCLFVLPSTSYDSVDDTLLGIGTLDSLWGINFLRAFLARDRWSGSQKMWTC